MEDSEIMKLYFARDEAAIQETASKYGAFCHGIAYNILAIREDCEECVNDTYLKAWDTIPPQQPDHFGAWLGKVVRNIALNLWKKNHRQKRYVGMEQLLDELAECIPSHVNVESEIAAAEITAILNQWLSSLPKDERILFVRRYWNGDTLKNLAKRYHTTPTELANRMFRMRNDLKNVLEREGILL